MNVDIDLDADLVKAEFTVAEFHEILDALRAVRDTPAKPEPPKPELPKVFRLQVASSSKPDHYYNTCIWYDAAGNRHGTCDCPDYLYRRHNWCKHLDHAVIIRQHQLSVLS